MVTETMEATTANLHFAFYSIAARELGLSAREVAPSVLEIRRGKKVWRLYDMYSPMNDACAAAMSSSKVVTSSILKSNRIPVPAFQFFTELEPAQAFFKANSSKDWVVKPDFGMSGKAVSIKPRTPEQFARAFRDARRMSKRVIVERFVAGRHFRLLVLGRKMIAAVERVPAGVVGNGRDSIRELIEQHEARRSKIDCTMLVDAEALQCLEAQGLSLESTPRAGEHVFVRQNANFSTGGTTIDVTAQVHPDHRELAVKATQAMGLGLAGVDLIVPDVSKPKRVAKGVINEVNPAPGLRTHYFPTVGRRQHVTLDILKHLTSGSASRAR